MLHCLNNFKNIIENYTPDVLVFCLQGVDIYDDKTKVVSLVIAW